MVANPLSLLRSRKTYSRYLKKIPPSENLALFGATQYEWFYSLFTQSPAIPPYGISLLRDNAVRYQNGSSAQY
eukprot:SAG11_NODE_17_length_26125_cov_45.892723_17_plen_73_part_00